MEAALTSFPQLSTANQFLYLYLHKTKQNEFYILQIG